MENTTNEIKINEIDLKIANEKLYIKTIAMNETIALRSIDSIAIIDLIDEFNDKLSQWKKKNFWPYLLYILGALYILIAITSQLPFAIIPGSILIAIGYFISKKIYSNKPQLKSSIRIFINGNIRDIEFNKSASNISKIAGFVATIESTLSGFHQNNNT